MMQSSFQPQRLDKNITKEEYLSKNVERNWQSKNVERDWESKNVDRDWESKKVERDWESKNVDRDWESKKKDKDVKPEKLDPIISREEYLDKNRVLPADRFADRFEDRFQTEKKPSTIHAKPSYSGVSGGAIIAEKGSEFIRPLNQHLVNHAAYNQPPYYEGERFSEPWGRSSIPMTYSKPMRYTGHEDPTFIDKSWSRQDRYYPGSNLPSRETSKLKGKEQREYIAERKNLATGYSSFSTPSKPNKEITKREYPDDREYFNPTILRPSTYRSGIKPSDMVVGAASDLFTSMGMKPKPVEYSPHESFINDPSEIVEALIKVQRVNPLTGKAESFHEEGLTTTLRIHRRMLKDHGLKKDDEGILEFMKRKHFDLDKIIDFNTRNSLKRAIGLGPLDNIKLELLPSSFTTSYPQTQVGQIFRRPIDQNRSFNDYSSWERERVPIGRSAFVGGPMIERRSYESPEGYYGRGDQWETEGVEHKRPGVFKRTFEGIKSTIRPHKEQDIEGEYAETGYERRPYEFRDQNYGRRADWQETEDLSPKKPSKMKEAIEGIKCTIQGPKYHLKHPEINPSTDEPVMEKWGGERWGQRGPISQNPVSFEERGYGYKSERPIYSSKQELGYERNRSVVGQGDFYDKGFVERPNYYDRGISQRTEEPYYRY